MHLSQNFMSDKLEYIDRGHFQSNSDLSNGKSRARSGAVDWSARPRVRAKQASNRTEQGFQQNGNKTYVYQA